MLCGGATETMGWVEKSTCLRRAPFFLVFFDDALRMCVTARTPTAAAPTPMASGRTDDDVDDDMTSELGAGEGSEELRRRWDTQAGGELACELARVRTRVGCA